MADRSHRDLVKEWEQRLVDEGLSMQRGYAPKSVLYVADTEPFQSGLRPHRDSTRKPTHRKSCVVCERSFEAKRKDAKTCSKACRDVLNHYRSMGVSALTQTIERLLRIKTSIAGINPTDNSAEDREL